MFRSLSLRTRVLLIFACLGLGSILIAFLALWWSYNRHGDPALFSPFLLAGLIIFFGIPGLTLFIWLLFDEKVAQAIESLAAALRASAHADVNKDMDPDNTGFLGDLGPAAQALNKRLSEEKYQKAVAIAEETRRLEKEKTNLTRLLTQIPIGVIMVGEDQQIILYDGQAAVAFEDYNPLGLGHPVSDYFSMPAIEKAHAALKANSELAALDLRLPSADHSLDFSANIRLLGEGLGYIITLGAEHHGLADRPLTFDFDITENLATRQLSSTLLEDLCFVVFDTETTGLSTVDDHVIQVGAVRILKGRRIDGEDFDCFVDPGRPIPPASTKVHGISDAMVKGALTFPEVAQKFHQFAKNSVLVAHNAPFDLAFFKREGEGPNRQFNHPVLDTVLLSAVVYGQSVSHNLDALAERLGITIKEADRHTALGDAIATAEVLMKLLPILSARGIRTLEEAQQAMRKHQNLLEVVNDHTGEEHA